MVGDRYGLVMELLLLVLSGAERLYHPDAGQVLLEHSGHMPGLGLNAHPGDTEAFGHGHGAPK